MLWKNFHFAYELYVIWSVSVIILNWLTFDSFLCTLLLLSFPKAISICKLQQSEITKWHDAIEKAYQSRLILKSYLNLLTVYLSSLLLSSLSFCFCEFMNYDWNMNFNMFQAKYNDGITMNKCDINREHLPPLFDHREQRQTGCGALPLGRSCSCCRIHNTLFLSLGLDVRAMYCSCMRNRVLESPADNC